MDHAPNDEIALGRDKSSSHLPRAPPALVGGRNGEDIDVEVKGPVALHDPELMIETALAGVALAYVWEDALDVESGRLVSCLTDWMVPEDWLYLYYPTCWFISAGLRAVIDALKVSSS